MLRRGRYLSAANAVWREEEDPREVQCLWDSGETAKGQEREKEREERRQVMPIA